MNNKKIIIRISNELGNQMFMYASAYGISKKMNRSLFIDNETAFTSTKNISTYGLSSFKITSDIAPNDLKFLGFFGYIKKKILKKIDYFKEKKKFFIEIKDKEKITNYNNQLYTSKFSDYLFLEGHFETQKYFYEFINDIRGEFNFNEEIKFKKSPFYNDIIDQNSVSICLRQNRFNEGLNKIGNEDKSKKYVDEQVRYINQSIKYMQKKIENPVFFIWSNDLTNVNENLFIHKVNMVDHNNNFCNDFDKRALDLFLMSRAKNHIVIPSTFNWWGAWLCNNNEKIITRPSDNFFADFKINNKDFWPNDWIVIKE